MVGLIKRNFKYLSISSFVLVYKNLVRSQLDYCNSVWSPYRKSDIDALEKVQKMATKLLPKIRHLKYADRLKTCKLPTMHYRRIREDIIETYKILSGKYDSAAIPILTTSPTLTTRGNDLRLQKNRARYDLRKIFFTNRIVNMWNSLPNDVVHAESTNTFKSRLDKFWSNQEIIYDYRAEIQGTGSRSEIY